MTTELQKAHARIAELEDRLKADPRYEPIPSGVTLRQAIAEMHVLYVTNASGAVIGWFYHPARPYIDSKAAEVRAMGYTCEVHRFRVEPGSAGPALSDRFVDEIEEAAKLAKQAEQDDAPYGHYPGFVRVLPDSVLMLVDEIRRQRKGA